VFTSLINLNKAINTKAERLNSSPKRKENSNLIRSRVQSSILYNRSRKINSTAKEDFLNHFNNGRTIGSSISVNLIPNDTHLKNEISSFVNAPTITLKANKKATSAINDFQNSLTLDNKRNKKTNSDYSLSPLNKVNKVKNTPVLTENISTNQSLQSKEIKSNKCNITVDISKARSNTEVLKMCLSELGWQDSTTGQNSGCDIIWQSCTSSYETDPGNTVSYSNYSRVNKFPCKYFYLGFYDFLRQRLLKKFFPPTLPEPYPTVFRYNFNHARGL
jgi:hypothetical protein